MKKPIAPVLCACCFRPLDKHADGLIQHCRLRLTLAGLERTIFTPFKGKK